MRVSIFAVLSFSLVAVAMPHVPDVQWRVKRNIDSRMSILRSPPAHSEPTTPDMEVGSDVEDPVEGDPKSLDTWKLRTVMQHNYYRARYGANQLVWSDALYPATQKWANQCQFRHSSSGGTYGENLAAGYGAYGFSTGLRDWMKEASLYNYSNPTFSPATGHFTQVVWKSTGEVACAMAHCEAGTIFPKSSKFIVCRYNPPGNYLGRFSENVGRPVPS